MTRAATPLNILDELMPMRSASAAIRESLKWDYSQLGEAGVGVREHAVQIKLSVRRANDAVVETGRHLLAVKASLNHGQWGDWLATEFSMTDRTAQTLMSIANRFDGKSEIISDLNVTVLGLLAAPSVPDTAVDAVIEARAQGKVTVADAKRIIDEHKPERANRRYESELPELNMPSPGAPPAPFGAQPKAPITDWELSEICETVAGEMFGDNITRSRIVGLTEAMVSDANAQNGAYWLKLVRTLAPFDVTDARIKGAVADAAQRMVAARSAPASTMTPEAKALAKEIKAATWGDSATKNAEVAAALTGETLADVLRPLVAEFYADGSDSWLRHAALDMGRNASDKEGAFWRRCVGKLDAAGYRQSTQWTTGLLRQALGLLADEAPPAEPLTPPVEPPISVPLKTPPDARIGQAQRLIAIYQHAISAEDEYGDLTGCYTETTTVKRELQKLINRLQHLVDLLEGRTMASLEGCD